MRKPVIVIIALLLSQALFSQSSDQFKHIQSDIDNIQNEVNRSKEKFITLEEKQENIILKLNFYSDIILQQDRTISFLISIIGILLAVTGLGIPILSYILVILPIRRNNRWFKNKFMQFEQQLFEENTDAAILDIQSESNDTRNKGYTYLYTNRYRKFKVDQLNKLKILEANSQHENIRQLCEILRLS